MTPVRILVDSLADQGLTNSQMTNAREIIRRLDPTRFHVSIFCGGVPDRSIAQRPNTRLVRLPQRRRTVRILREFLLGRHDILFYVKSSPASRLYMAWRKGLKDRRITVATVESQSDVRNEPTITLEAVHLWERTVLRCDYLFSNSQSVQQSLQREYNLSSEVVPTGVNTRFLYAGMGPPGQPSPASSVCGIVASLQTAATVAECRSPFSRGGFFSCRRRPDG